MFITSITSSLPHTHTYAVLTQSKSLTYPLDSCSSLAFLTLTLTSLEVKIGIAETFFVGEVTLQVVVAVKVRGCAVVDEHVDDAADEVDEAVGEEPFLLSSLSSEAVVVVEGVDDKLEVDEPREKTPVSSYLVAWLLSLVLLFLLLALLLLFRFALLSSRPDSLLPEKFFSLLSLYRSSQN